ncbi:peptidylprolyl isomerase [Chlorogloeopsis sp. ULAP01]|jgi:parvulin-like peptidyl-prolyl isomerase|uniref:peptidylprolyl isomerase n=1 Tax=Chlorogloeopsis sp. ULAP01 TaxID=3056483 RepID=UPI0025AAFC32|nr:peptidylprolyl isomerase [Chlorogloeopsis sp. ULAP01]MDM9383445.1 peptidylprolyl isomerase [Chlorogloeopsis sp. ULAP01]
MSILFQLGDSKFATDEVVSMMAQYQLVPQLVKEMIIDKAIADIEYTPEEAQIACQQLAKDYQLSSEVMLKEWLQRNAMEFKQFESIAIRQLKLEKFKRIQWGGDIESYFLQRKPMLNRVVYSLIRTSNIGIAQELCFRIQEGEESFAELARKYTEGPEAETDGLVGPVELQKIYPGLAKILSCIQPQQLSPPVKIGDWIVIVRLEKFLVAKLDRPMRYRLLNERFNHWLQEQVAALNWQVYQECQEE